MPALPELQREFVAAVFTGDVSTLAGAVTGRGFTPEQCIQVYRNNSFITLTEALAATYPAIVRLVGRGFFNYAATRYISANPPDRPCLFEYGACFADFLAGFPAAAGYAFLPDVARLEWAVNVAWNAPEVTPLAFEALAAAATGRGESLQVSLDAAYLPSAWSVDVIRQANCTETGEDTDMPPMDEPVRLQIRRNASGVMIERLEPATWTLRYHLARGETLGDAATAAFAENAGFDLAAALRILAAENLPLAILPPMPTRSQRHENRHSTAVRHA